MNKYKAHSRKAQAKRKQAIMCLEKRAYPTKADAYQKGQRSYQCPYCQQWHRSGSLSMLIAKVKNR